MRRPSCDVILYIILETQIMQHQISPRSTERVKHLEFLYAMRHVNIPPLYSSASYHLQKSTPTKWISRPALSHSPKTKSSLIPTTPWKTSPSTSHMVPRPLTGSDRIISRPFWHLRVKPSISLSPLSPPASEKWIIKGRMHTSKATDGAAAGSSSWCE